MPTFEAIVAMDEGRVIGINGTIPWRLPEDLKRFSALTRGHTVLMGRKTFESLPPKYRPLPDRMNVVISRTASGWTGVKVFRSIEEFLGAIERSEITLPSSQVWIVGGAQVYRETMPLWSAVELTRVAGKHDGDTYFPEFESDFECVGREDHPGFAFERWVRRAGEPCL